MADMKKIGQALQGFGAGFRGKGQEFIQSVNEEKQATAERDRLTEDQARQEQLMANRVLLGDLQAGNVDRAVSGLNTRLVGLNERGANTDFTEGLKGLVESGPEGIQEAIRISQAADQEAVTRGMLEPIAVEEPYTLAPGAQRFRGGEMIAENVVPVIDKDEAISQTPPALLVGLDEDTAARASAAFVAAGGGAAGVDALGEQIKLGAEAQQRADVPMILDSSFPNASPAERAQLDAAVRGAKSVEAGLKVAGDIRTEQRRLKKAKSFQERAVSLLDGILGNTELNAVIGPIQGSAAGFHVFDPMETDVIADIEEVQDILTAENMDLMTGVLSESDIQLLKNLSSGALNRKRSEARFRKDVETLRKKLSSVLVETIDDIAGDSATNGTDKEGDLAVNPNTGERMVFTNGQWVPQ